MTATSWIALSGNALQLVGIALVVSDFRKGRRAAMTHLQRAERVTEATGGLFNIGLGGAVVKGDVAIGELADLRRGLAEDVASTGLRALAGALAAGFGTVLDMVAIALS